MATPQEALAAIGSDWRVWRNLQQRSPRKAADAVDSAFTPAHLRTVRQERVVFELQAQKDKRDARDKNVGMAHGARIHTSNGARNGNVTYQRRRGA